MGMILSRQQQSMGPRKDFMKLLKFFLLSALSSAYSSPPAGVTVQIRWFESTVDEMLKAVTLDSELPFHSDTLKTGQKLYGNQAIW